METQNHEATEPAVQDASQNSNKEFTEVNTRKSERKNSASDVEQQNKGMKHKKQKHPHKRNNNNTQK